MTDSDRESPWAEWHRKPSQRRGLGWQGVGLRELEGTDEPWREASQTGREPKQRPSGQRCGPWRDKRMVI